MSDRPPDVWVLNTNAGEPDVLHRNPGEQCNTDDAEGRQTLDESTARGLLASSTDIVKCQHCFVEG